MAILISKRCKGHKNIYVDNPVDREMRVEIGLPETGMNEETGMLVLIPGYGGGIDSHVWKRMRNEFSDMYNMITMQCDYFGNKFMDTIIPEEISNLVETKNMINAKLVYERKMLETEDEFNDMGLMQAVDIINATLHTISDLEKLGHRFNIGKIIIFGSSHGSYVAHLANLICPDLYSCILDISAYLVPYYLDNIRTLTFADKKMHLTLFVKQFLNAYPWHRYHKSLYDLEFLYKNAENKCKIIVFQGTEDWMIDANQKVKFAEDVKNVEMMLIGPEDVDGTVFKNADHSLGLDFFKFFELIIPMIERLFEKKEGIILRENIVIGDETARIEISYEMGMPEIKYFTGCEKVTKIEC